MTLPLFSGPDDGPVEWIAVESAEARAWHIGFGQGAGGQTAIVNYDPHDARVTGYYEDGYRIGRLFRPLPCMEHIRDEARARRRRR